MNILVQVREGSCVVDESESWYSAFSQVLLLMETMIRVSSLTHRGYVIISTINFTIGALRGINLGHYRHLLS